MRIGTIGAGLVARAVATVAIRHGHEVMVSNTRGPETLFSLVGTFGCKAGSPKDAAQFGDIVLVAIPLKNYRSIPVEPLQGKIVLDANNYYPERDGHIAKLDRGDVTTSELVASHLPNRRSSRSSTPYKPRKLRATRGPRVTQTDEHFRLPATTLKRKSSWRICSIDVVDAGPLVEGKRFQKDTPGYCVRLNREKLINALALA